jgi:hypothetical protein
MFEKLVPDPQVLDFGDFSRPRVNLQRRRYRRVLRSSRMPWHGGMEPRSRFSIEKFKCNKMDIRYQE